MSAPAVIDSVEFARSGETLSGSVPLAQMKRLEDVLDDSEGRVDYVLRGGVDERKRPRLDLRVSGVLHLQCQRCLGRLDYPVEIANTLLLLPRGVPAEEELDDPEGPDAIEASTELDVIALVEDEVLLSLPLSPRHAEGACMSRAAARVESADAPPAPFAKLAELKSPRNNH